MVANGVGVCVSFDDGLCCITTVKIINENFRYEFSFDDSFAKLMNDGWAWCKEDGIDLVEPKQLNSNRSFLEGSSVAAFDTDYLIRLV